MLPIFKGKKTYRCQPVIGRGYNNNICIRMSCCLLPVSCSSRLFTQTSDIPRPFDIFICDYYQLMPTQRLSPFFSDYSTANNCNSHDWLQCLPRSSGTILLSV